MLSSTKARAPILSFGTLASMLALTLLPGCGSDGHGKGIGSLADDSSSGDSSGETSGGETSGGATSGATTGGGPSSDHLLVVSAKLSPSKPIVFLATLDGATAGSISMAVTALSAADRTTPVGETFLAGPFDLEADGTFQASLPSVDLPGEANPISGSALTGVTAVLSATEATPFVCGTVSGSIDSPPLNLEGSTFTLLAIVDPNAWPSVVIDCAGTPAAPIGE